MIIFQKSPVKRKYSKPEDTIYNSVTWYYGPQGLRAFRPTKNYIEVFNAHLFNRYNERMDLHISRHADTIRRFFLNSGMLLQETISHNGREYMMSMCKEGAALGNYHEVSSRRRWLVHNTFITHDQMFKNQVEGKFKYLTNTIGKLTALIQERDLTKLDQMQEHITHLITHLDIVA